MKVSVNDSLLVVLKLYGYKFQSETFFKHFF